MNFMNTGFGRRGHAKFHIALAEQCGNIATITRGECDDLHIFIVRCANCLQ